MIHRPADRDVARTSYPVRYDRPITMAADGRNNVNLTHTARCGFESVVVRVHSAQLAVPLERGTPKGLRNVSARSSPDPSQVKPDPLRLIAPQWHPLRLMSPR
jgi:hypothetical protein